MSNICRCGTYQRVRAAIHSWQRGTKTAAADATGLMNHAQA